MRSEFAAQTSDTAAAEPADGHPCPAKSVRASFVSFERSAALALSLLIAGSFALQSLVIAHGHVAGTVSGQAVAALVAEVPSRPAPPVTVAGADASHSLLNVGVGLSRSLETSARVAAAEAASEASSGLGLRTSTFGPDTSKTPRIRTAMLGPAAIGNAPAPAREVRPDEHQEVIVIRPGGPRTLNLSNNRAAPAPQAAPQARVLGKATPGEAAGLVDKVHFQPHTPERCLPHDLLDVIYDVAERFGEVQILSTFRDPERNRRVGGAEQSFHLSCQAIDFRVSGKTAGLLSYLEGRGEVGGLKRYPMGYFHIDNGPRRSW